MNEITSADVVIVGAGLAGLTAAAELADGGKSAVVVEQEGRQSAGGQAFWSFGGLFYVDSPEQRRLGIRDSEDLAWADWQGTAGFDRPEDALPEQWARAYVHFAAGEKRSWLHQHGHRLFPVVGWAERGDGTPTGHGNSVPRFHITWGTGPALVDVMLNRLAPHLDSGRVRFAFRHKVTELLTEGGTPNPGTPNPGTTASAHRAARVTGVVGQVLAEDGAERGAATSRTPVGDFEIRAQAVILATGGIGGNHEAVRRLWPQRLGTPPQHMIAGVPAYVDGSGQELARGIGASLINEDRMWHYVEGVQNHAPVWENHGIRILPGPSSLWLDATGRRLPAPLFPGFDTLGTLEHLRRTGHDHSWFVTTEEIMGKEFALSGQEQNPDLTGKSVRGVLGRATADMPGPVRAFQERGADFLTASTLEDLISQMRAMPGGEALDPEQVRREVLARDAQLANGFGKDTQLAAVRAARHYTGDRLIRTASPRTFTDGTGWPCAYGKGGKLVAVKLHILTRKSLGGLHTDLGSRVLAAQDLMPDAVRSPGAVGSPQVIEGLYAAGEAAGFGGGGVHGYRSLEGTFLGGCLFTGLQAARDLLQRL